jgi:uncharacterized protein YndB with AHSA1/START domain
MEQNHDLSLHVTRAFGVPVERLFAAWTTEEDLRQWWQPMGNRLRRLTNDLKEGGSVKYEFETAEGESAFTIDGVYKEAQAGERLVYTWNWKVPNDAIQDSEFLLTVTFTGEDGGSKLDVRQENFVNEEAVRPHREGWEKGLEGLQDYLSRQ